MVFTGASGAWGAGMVLTGACADAVAAKPKLSTVAVVVPIKRLNVIDAFSTYGTHPDNHRNEITPLLRSRMVCSSIQDQ
jgi:hypothetical protein